MRQDMRCFLKGLSRFESFQQRRICSELLNNHSTSARESFPSSASTHVQSPNSGLPSRPMSDEAKQVQLAPCFLKMICDRKWFSWQLFPSQMCVLLVLRKTDYLKSSFQAVTDHIEGSLTNILLCDLARDCNPLGD
jgi:hypothetical protein